ncbi:hypothetical protein Desor_4576 [Desulfosporosinus orientis DSM 765]|uniref:Uncharacterized protein n=1 Tax=Desulfosporosinus orientis (strain ATCC 19365 / DSM 765 / NCIMB 8382 / VKM B-1628 / Singapore I) TaxID=768706 RepID=G7WC07_DESOD|nr:hypothetical protein [Desulfosporosinus orientis]AET69981.1 hypothetical protein Desor_4576 [Desulfosporosinus orientis DSM 765]
MDTISATSIIDLGSINLVLVPRLNSALEVIQLKVYEREGYFLNPNPEVNESQIAEYSICSSCYTQGISEIRDLYEGWARIDKAEPVTLIGIHNQNPNILYIQFSLGDQYFMYKRCLLSNKEMIYEELFGKKPHLRWRSLNKEDEQYLMAKLRFMPKAKNAISFYTYSAQKRIRRRYAFSHSKG